MRRLLYVAVLATLTMLVFAPASMAQTRGPSGADGSYNCPDFDDQGQAQEFQNQLVRAGGDPSDLDDDGDGMACDTLPRVTNPNTPATQTQPTPQPTETGDAPQPSETGSPKLMESGGNLPATGGPTFLLPAGALLVGSGLLALGIMRRQ